MNEPSWLIHFVDSASRDPQNLLRTIAAAKSTELKAAEVAVRMIKDPHVKILGFITLAHRSREHRQEFLTEVAITAESLSDPTSRVAVLIAVIDTLPSTTRSRFAEQLSHYIRDLTPNQQRRFQRLFTERNSMPAQERRSIPTSVEAAPISIINLDYIENIIAKIHKRSMRTSKRTIEKMHTVGRGGGPYPKVRLREIANSIGFSPELFTRGTSTVKRTNLTESVSIEDAQKAAMCDTTERVVNTGFAGSNGQPTIKNVNPGDCWYYFIEIGPRLENAVDSGTVLPEDLSTGSVIDVEIYMNDDGMTLEGPHSGAFKIEENGSVVVVAPAAQLPVKAALLHRRMFFAFRAPIEVGNYSIRCSFYCRGTLLQSRHIHVPVGMREAPSVTVDYVLTRTFSPNRLAKLTPPRLSIMLNRNENGTHSFRFYGSNGEFKNSSTFKELELSDYITLARKGLRHLAWGKEEEWTPCDQYRFSNYRSVDDLFQDLLPLVRRGRAIWDAVINRLAGGRQAADDLMTLMRSSGYVHLALKEAANAILPLALFYDHKFDSSQPDSAIALCDSFVKSLGEQMIEGPCLNGACPNKDRENIICPGGFWGFRHAIGLPVSIGSDPASPPDISLCLLRNNPLFTIGVSTDPQLTQKSKHLDNIKMKTGSMLQVEDSRNNVLKALENANSSIIYFYCHGGLDKIDGPYLEVGPPAGPRIVRSNLRDISWQKIRPIVFINGCNTTGVTPEKALELVSGFVETYGASGVIGTEITVFESLAGPFAEAFFESFVNESRPAGEAIRRARIRMLQDSLNPLGLAYIPFVMPDLTLCSNT